jgi:hypothetical protein
LLSAIFRHAITPILRFRRAAYAAADAPLR